MRFARPFAWLAALIFMAALAPASRAELHLEVSGVLSYVDGPSPAPLESPFVTGLPPSSELFGWTPGFSAGASFDWGSRFAIGARSGMLRVRSGKDILLVFDPPGPSGPFQTPVDFQHKLTMIPTHGLFQYRWKHNPKTAFHAEVGAGVISFTEKFQFNRPGAPGEPFAFYQTSFSYLAGAGAAREFYRGLAVAASADFMQAITKDGDVWRSGDNPWMVVGTVGLRYPL